MAIDIKNGKVKLVVEFVNYAYKLYKINHDIM